MTQNYTIKVLSIHAIKYRDKMEKKEPMPLEKLHNSLNQKNIVIVLTIVYFIVGIIGIYHHEMWRDEIRAWLISSNSKNLLELSYNARYEGHPILWHSILFIATQLNLPIISMQVIHVLIATASIFLIFWYSPFSLIEKTSLAFGHYLLYEYMIISRAYGLGILLVYILVVLCDKPIKNLIYISVVLLLLSNTSIWGLITALGTGFAILINILPQLKEHFTQKRKFLIFILSIIIATSGFIISFLQIQPAPDVSMPFEYTFNFNKERLVETLAVFTKAHLLKTTNIYIGVLIATVILVSIRKNLFAILFYLIPTIGIVLFLYITGKNDLRYLGILPVLFISSLWLYIKPRNNTNHSPVLTSLKRRQPFTTKLALILFILIAILQGISGVKRYTEDLSKRYSNIQATGEFIKKRKLYKYPIAGEIDYLTTPFVLYSKKPVYVIARDEDCNFAIFDKKRFKNKQNIFTSLENHIKKYMNFEKLILISQRPYYNNQQNKKHRISKARISKNLKIKLLRDFDQDCIRQDEKFYVYEISKINKLKE